MKNNILYLAIVLLIGLNSCQKDDINQSVTTQNLTKSSTLTLLASRVSQYPTHKDNVLDGTSCFAVVLPVTVTVNSYTLLINDSGDYSVVRHAIEEHSDDDDVIHFGFPIKLKYRNFQEVQVTNQEQYNSILSNCPADNLFYEIECIDFNFPIVINAYDSATQTPSTVTITTNSQMFNYMDGLNSNVFYSLVYPLSMTKSNGETIVFSSNTEMQAGIENVIADCNDDGSGSTILSDIIVNGTWYVSSFIEENENETYHFNGYIFAFSANGSVVAYKNTIALNGSWSNYLENSYSKLDLSFDGSTLEKLEYDWRIIEFSPTLIKLRHVSGEDGKTHYLSFTKN
jgi:hypothetical protein